MILLVNTSENQAMPGSTSKQSMRKDTVDVKSMESRKCLDHSIWNLQGLHPKHTLELANWTKLTTGPEIEIKQHWANCQQEESTI